ncbi:hypothetical protein SFRURICE_006126, partial [Spodoptera frugiperda]
GSILYIENIERINSRGCYWIDTKPKYLIKFFFVFLSLRSGNTVTQNGEIKLPREDRHPRGRSRGRKLVVNIVLSLYIYWIRFILSDTNNI